MSTGRSQLFTVRLWAEEPEPGRREYRGEVTHPVTGARRPFREWAALETFLVETVERHGDARPTSTSSREERDRE